MVKTKQQEIQIVPVMVGTAGHVDHGKTELVKLLTGCDTDRLEEEKARGLSIDLGFAPFMLFESRMVGIIDVPGHEDFIRNMVAGASSIDVLILVIAADDGIMPQTIEHLKVVSLLKTPQVMTVITKIDLVDEKRKQSLKQEVDAFLSNNGFSNASIIFESNKTKEGVEEVRSTINKLVDAIRFPPSNQAFRMDIERVFSVKGYGTVVTGIPKSGACKIGDKCEIYPGVQKTAVRALQKYKHDSKNTEAHVCSAINIRNIESTDIRRGMSLASPGVFKETFSAILDVKNVHDSLTIKRQQDLHLHYGTSIEVVSGLLVEKKRLAPGENGFMRIKCSRPMLLAAGDKFILRSLSPSTTVAGGTVLTVRTKAQRRARFMKSEQLAKAKEAIKNDDPFLSELLMGESPIISSNDWPQLLQRKPHDLQSVIEEKQNTGVVRALSVSKWIVPSRANELEEKLRLILVKYHKNNKTSHGMPHSEAIQALKLDKNCCEGLQDVLKGSAVIETFNNCFALKNFKVALNNHQQLLKNQIIERLSSLSDPAIAQGDLQEQCKASSADMQLIVQLLIEEGAVFVVEHFLIHSTIMFDCFNKLMELFENQDSITLKDFRQITGFSRNLAVAILEHYDLKGITRREGNGRVLKRKP